MFRANVAALVGALAAACGGPPGALDAGPADAVPPDAAVEDFDAGRPDAGLCADLPDGRPCFDGNLCTQTDACESGVCVGTQPIVCIDSDPCLPAACDPLIGGCMDSPLPDGTECEDGSVCTTADACLAGECTGDPVDLPGDLCDDGICFTDVATGAGIVFATTSDFLPRQITGASGVFFDADGDGWLDIAIGSETGTPRLFRNTADGGFEDMTVASGFPALTPDDLFVGFAAGDIDNDGDADLYFLFDGPNRLYANNGSGVFSNVTPAAGVAGGDLWTTSAAFGDYDADGWLDLYVGNYISPISPTTASPNVLYRNLGDGTFEDVTTATGTAGDGVTLAIGWTDSDDDADVDLWVCNDFGEKIAPNCVYENTGASLTETSSALGAELAIYCMGIAPGDYDRDGDLDYYFTNIGRNVLLENGGASFSDATDAAGVGVVNDVCYTDVLATSWGAGFVDFDADGWLDLYVPTGEISPVLENAVLIRNVLFRHDGPSLTFTDVSHTAGVDDDQFGRTAAFGDYDADGDVDILQVNLDGVRLLRNDSPSPGGSIQVDVRGRASNRDGLGVRMWLELPTTTLVREIATQVGYSTSSERAAHFGVGTEPEAERLRVRWPSGVEHDWLHVPAGTRALAVEPVATIESVAVAADPVAEGAEAELQVVVRNETSAPVSIDVIVTLRVPGESPVTGSPVNVVVPAASTAMTTAGATVPAGSAPTLAELVASATDVGGGDDQAAATVTLVP